VPPRDDPEYFAPIAGRLDDQALVCAIHIADRDPTRLGLDSEAVQAAALSAFTAEVLRRLDARKAA
jgi:hypothetical protein